MTHIITKRPYPTLPDRLRRRAADIIAIASISLLLAAVVAVAGYVGLSRAEAAFERQARPGRP